MVPLWTKNLQLAHTPTCIKISVFMLYISAYDVIKWIELELELEFRVIVQSHSSES